MGARLQLDGALQRGEGSAGERQGMACCASLARIWSTDFSGRTSCVRHAGPPTNLPAQRMLG